MVARLESLTVEGYRSVDDPQVLRFPSGRPLVIVGNNNAGKSNVVSALELLLGERWPGSFQPEPRDYFIPESAASTRRLKITASVSAWPTSSTSTTSVELSLEAVGSKVEFHVVDRNTGRWLSVNNEARYDTLRSIFVSARTDLRYQLSYQSQYTWLAKLMKRFYQAVNHSTANLAKLTAAFEQIEQAFREIPELATFRSDLTTQISAMAGSFGYAMDVDFAAYDPRNFFHALRLQATAAGMVRSLDELGTGQQQILCIAFACAYAKAFGQGGEGLVLIVEEPEAHLSPASQEWLGAYLETHASAGMQVVITSHSPHFLTFENLGGIARVWRDSPLSSSLVEQPSLTSIVRNLHRLGAPMATEATTPSFYEGNATLPIKNAFFTEVAVLVEGETEALSFPVMAQRLRPDVYQRGVRFIACNGKTDIPKWIRLLDAYEIPHYAIFDHDNKLADDHTHIDLMDALGVPSADRAPLLVHSGFLVADDFAILGRDYEHAMEHEFPDFAALKEAAPHALGGAASKSIKARWIAQQIDLDAETSGRKKFLDLLDALEALLPVSISVRIDTHSDSRTNGSGTAEEVPDLELPF